LPLKRFEHHSTTFTKQGAVWGNYWDYRARLQAKWSSHFQVITT